MPLSPSLVSRFPLYTHPYTAEKEKKMTETLRPAFAGRALPRLSYGLPFPDAAARHVDETFHASRVFVICSASLARNTDSLQRLKDALGPGRVVGERVGMRSHTLWSEVVEVVHAAREVEADLLITLGAGSLTDAAKIVALVRFLHPSITYISY